MKNNRKLYALVAGLILSTAIASADTIQLGSYGSTAPANQFGNANTALAFSGSPTYDIGTGGIWTAAGANSSWVAQNPGDCPGCGNVEPNGIYTFTTTFTLSSANYAGSISVLADDTTDVIINGIDVEAFATGPNVTCETAEPNCEVPALVTLSASDFVSGLNTIVFDVHQDDLAAEGVDFYGSISSTVGSPSVPEPSTLLLLGTGLIGSAGALLRRVRRPVQ